MDEVAEVIALPGFDHKGARNKVNPDSVDLGPKVKAQLFAYVSWVAQSYNDNPFHNCKTFNARFGQLAFLDPRAS